VSGLGGLGWLEVGETADLVLADLEMLEMSGWDVVQAVTSRWPTVMDRRRDLCRNPPASLIVCVKRVTCDAGPDKLLRRDVP
jgi:CheY-like chemotaxis protein